MNQFLLNSQPLKISPIHDQKFKNFTTFRTMVWLPLKMNILDFKNKINAQKKIVLT